MTDSSNKIQCLPEPALHLAENHLRDILSLAIKHTSDHAALVVYDELCPLAATLTEAYRRCLPNAEFVEFYTATPEDIIARFAALAPSDLVVLIQSTSFRLNAFRLRVELFSQSIKVIEHPHLIRMLNEEPMYYIEALAYDADYYRNVGNALKIKIDQASHGMVESGGEQLVYGAAFESAKLNIGDYSEMNNVGGQFPIGEVFTEAQDLETVNGRVRIFAFGDTTFSVNKVEHPITLTIAKGRIVEVTDSTPEFDKVLANIREDEGEVWLRELGFGMNRALTSEKTVTDIGTYERMCGVHLSIGAKHGVYKKANLRRADTWHHVDIFAVTNLVYLDDQIVYEKGAWVV